MCPVAVTYNLVTRTARVDTKRTASLVDLVVGLGTRVVSGALLQTLAFYP